MLIVVLAVLGVLALLALLLSDRGEGEGFERAAFVELQYDVAFRALGDEAMILERPEPQELDGYIHRQDAGVLIPAMGEPLRVKRPGLVVGTRTELRFRPHGSVPRSLAVYADATVTHGTRSRLLEAIRFLDPDAWDALPDSVRISADVDHCRVAAGDTEVDLEPQERCVLGAVSRTHDAASFLARVAKAEGRPARASVDRLARQLGLDPNQPVELHLRLTAIFRGYVRVEPIDAKALRRAALADSRRGAWASSIGQAERYLALVPEDEAMRRRLQTDRATQAAGVTVHNVAGRVVLPGPVDSSMVPPTIWVQRQDDPEGPPVAVTYALDGAFSLALRAGTYTLHGSASGFREKSVPLTLQADREVDLVFTAEDRR